MNKNCGPCHHWGKRHHHCTVRLDRPSHPVYAILLGALARSKDGRMLPTVHHGSIESWSLVLD